MADIVIPEFMDETAIENLKRDFAVQYDPALVDDTDGLCAALAQNARALIVRNRTQVRGKILESATALQVVGRLGVGLDNIDMDACAARGIAVKPATGANNIAVAEYVIATALMLLRGSFTATTNENVIAGAWPRGDNIGREMAGKKIGFIGYGGIAREVAKRAGVFGADCIAHDPHVKSGAGDATQLIALETLLTTADIISLHVPLTDETAGLIDAQAIAQMKPDCIFINTARGGVVDELALCAALKKGRLGGAALDVFAQEPIDATGGAAFRDVPNLILTPHIAGVTAESNIRVSAMTAAQVRAVLEAG